MRGVCRWQLFRRGFGGGVLTMYRRYLRGLRRRDLLLGVPRWNVLGPRRHRMHPVRVRQLLCPRRRLFLYRVRDRHLRNGSWRDELLDLQ